MLLWKRRWRIIVGTLDFGTLDVKFSVSRTLAPRAGTADLTVFNLTEGHRNEIMGYRRARLGQRALVRIEAGHEAGSALIFQGDSRKVELHRDGTEWAVKVTAGDGEFAIRNARVNVSLGPGCTFTDVVGAVAEAMGLGLGNSGAVIAQAQLGRVGRTFPEGCVLHGTAARELTRLCSSAGLEWSCQDGNLQLVRRGTAVTQQVVLLRQDTGLVGAPVRGKNRTVEVTALLQPDIVPGRLVKLESPIVSGTYRIETADYSGETRGNDWYAKLVLRLPTPPIRLLDRPLADASVQ